MPGHPQAMGNCTKTPERRLSKDGKQRSGPPGPQDGEELAEAAQSPPLQSYSVLHGLVGPACIFLRQSIAITQLDRELRPEEIEGEVWGRVPRLGPCGARGAAPPWGPTQTRSPWSPPICGKFPSCHPCCSIPVPPHVPLNFCPGPHLSTCSPHFPSPFLSFHLFISVPITALVPLSPHPGPYLTTHSPSFPSKSPSLHTFPSVPISPPIPLGPHPGPHLST